MCDAELDVIVVIVVRNTESELVEAKHVERIIDESLREYILFFHILPRMFFFTRVNIRRKLAIF